MNEVLYIKKPKGITSFKLCQKLRPVFNTRAIGHTGTLDPMASGVMIVLVDKACKLNQFLVGHDKTYVATVKLGIKTSTEDIEGAILEKRVCLMPSREELESCLKSFLGKSLQTPPMTSAIKIKGKKLYEYQRAKQEVEVPKRAIEVYAIELLNMDDETFSFKAQVSSGTYIRSLARDILAKLGLIGTLCELERTSVGQVHLNDCDDLEEVLRGNYQRHSTLEVLQNDYQMIEVDDPKPILDGKRFTLDSDQKRVLLTYNKDALAIYELVKTGEYKCVRGLF